MAAERREKLLPCFGLGRSELKHTNAREHPCSPDTLEGNELKQNITCPRQHGLQLDLKITARSNQLVVRVRLR